MPHRDRECQCLQLPSPRSSFETRIQRCSAGRAIICSIRARFAPSSPPPARKLTPRLAASPGKRIANLLELGKPEHAGPAGGANREPDPAPRVRRRKDLAELVLQ
jgi:hypothetical protein